MVAEPRVWVDVEGAVRAWAREAVPSVAERVLFGANGKAPLPQIVLFRIAGPDDRCLIQFDVWASKKADAAELAAELCTAADALSRYERDGVLLHGARVLSSRWQPDFESDTPRYIVEALFFATSTGDVDEHSS